ncbi:hypothetical protein BGZ61DRAFT_582842 [Ilyonectria robusta]|uniref:uncharacterized protein n=1 Tax=Ilyonectria robusta TaxID=1079257 RepID=UPI001E8E659F|nr:uncharacterized protein BGZ61DRAFT_582842 [Ilyonectria robusta]KAH8737756.1 hypothetical protein BGZ61DRAFT_582842 [Ilyonectria robusta]
MGKRDFDQVGSPYHGSPEPYSSGPSKKQKQSGKSKNRPNEGSSQWARKRARNIDRLLQRNQDLPANVRNDLERELAAHKTTVTDKAFQKKRSAMIGKYHMVRFFERKRAMRLAKQVRKRLEQSSSPEETEELKRHLHIAEVDEAYTQSFPHLETYVSLYKTESAKDDKDEDKAAKSKALLEAERPPMWSTIEQAMREGPSALRMVRERRSSDEAQGGSQPERKQRKQRPTTTQTQNKPAARAQPTQQQKEKAAPQKNGDAPANMNRRERRRLMREAGTATGKDDDSDDGGFFEEG